MIGDAAKECGSRGRRPLAGRGQSPRLALGTGGGGQDAEIGVDGVAGEVGFAQQEGGVEDGLGVDSWVIFGAAEGGEAVIGDGWAAVEHFLDEDFAAVALDQFGDEGGGGGGGAVLEVRDLGEGGEVGVVEEGDAAWGEEGEDLGDVGLEDGQVGVDEGVVGEDEVEAVVGDGLEGEAVVGVEAGVGVGGEAGLAELGALGGEVDAVEHRAEGQEHGGDAAVAGGDFEDGLGGQGGGDAGEEGGEEHALGVAPGVGPLVAVLGPVVGAVPGGFVPG